jgi:hypothetical protein
MNGADFEKLILRIYKGLIVGAKEGGIIAQLESENIPRDTINYAMIKAKGSYERTFDKITRDEV